MAHSNWEADKMLDVYIYDYLLKRKWHDSAKAFMTEGKVATDPVAIDAPGGFLFEWWSVFWDIFIARTNDKHSEPAAAYIEAQQIKAREHQQQLHLQQLQAFQQRNSHLQRRDPSHPPLGGSINSLNSEGMMGQQPASLLALKMYEERIKQPHSMDTAVSPALMDANRMALLKASANSQGPMVQGNSGGLPTALQQIQNRAQMTSEIKNEVDLGANQKSMSLDPSSIYGQAILQSKSGLSNTGINQGITSPLRGWPLTGIDNMRPSLGLQAQKPCFQTQNQFSLASQQQQVIQGQVQATQGVMGNSPNYGGIDSRRLCLPRGAVNTKNGQPTRNDGSICSPVQSNSPKVKMGQMQQSSSQHDQLQQQQQSQQNNRKRKPHSSSGAANSTGTANTVGISPNSPPSTHTPGDALTSTNGLNHVNNNMSKGLLLYPEGTGGLGPSSNLLDDIEHFGEVGSLEDNVESFLRNDGDQRELYGGLKQSSTEPKKESSKGFTFEEVGCIRTKNSKVTCCHFSSDGKLLASAGHDWKAILWNMDTLQTQSTAEEHKFVITDIRFRPNSSQLITASYDSSVRLWDAANPSYSLHAYTGHRAPIMSVDFHPKTDLFCFCDAENEIGYWNINPFACTRISKGGTAQVRFQPRTGQYLAAASGEVVSIFDVEMDAQTHSFQGQSKQVNYICWHESGNYLATVSQDCVKLWSISTGECIHELISPATDFHSCVFHPTYSSLLVIGGASGLELWNTSENRRMTVSAHEDIIAGLAQSHITGMVASASHDSSVKLWK